MFILKAQSTLFSAGPQGKETNLRASKEVKPGADKLNKWTTGADVVLHPSRGCHRRATKKGERCDPNLARERINA